MMRCANCNSEIPVASKFCGNCGVPIVPAAEAVDNAALSASIMQAATASPVARKGIARKIWDIFFWIILAVLVVFTALLVMSSANLGVHAYDISSGSMSPAIKTASLVFVRPSKDYKVGDIVTFVNPGGTLTTHRVVEIKKEGTGTVLTTQGDANNTPDMDPVLQSAVKGKVVFSLPYIGYAVSFFKTIPGLVIFVAVFAALLVEAFWGDIEKLSDKRKGSRRKAGALKSS